MTVMSNPGFAMYSNNNYIPDIGQFNGQQPRCRQPTTTVFHNNPGFAAPFSFAVPTQANSYTFTPSQSYQPRGIYSNPVIHQAIAPGIGTSWQHAVPNQMPWGEDRMLSRHNSPGISTFSASSAINEPITSIYSSIPSCSTTPKRHKRHSSIDIEKEAPNAKCLVTEERMAAKMEGLSLDHGMPTSSSGVCNGTVYPLDVLDLDFSGNSNVTCSSMTEDWKRFRELENRLNSESDEEDTQSKENGVKVHISKNIAKNILESPAILPRNILNNLNKPCMEMVLWQSPGGFDPGNVKTTSETTTTTTSSSSTQCQPITTNSSIFCLNSNNSKTMDEDTMDMDEMDL